MVDMEMDTQIRVVFIDRRPSPVLFAILVDDGVFELEGSVFAVGKKVRIHYTVDGQRTIYIEVTIPGDTAGMVVEVLRRLRGKFPDRHQNPEGCPQAVIRPVHHGLTSLKTDGPPQRLYIPPTEISDFFGEDWF